MTNSPFAKAALAQVAMEHVPPLIRRTLLNDRTFSEEFGFKAEAVITLGASEFTVQRTTWSGQAFCDNPVKRLFSTQQRLIRNRSGLCNPV